MPSVVSLGLTPFEGLIDCFSHAYNLEKYLVLNSTGVTITQTKEQLLGAPIGVSSGKANLLPTASVTTSNILGIILDFSDPLGIVALANAGTSTAYATVIVRGPATYVESSLKTVDAAGAALVMATVKTSLLTNGIRVITKPLAAATSTQLT